MTPGQGGEPARCLGEGAHGADLRHFAGAGSGRGQAGTDHSLLRPASLVDYVLAHELVHLIHEDHSRDFWSTLGRIMPDYEERKKRLREMGPRLVW
jgi:hypothetical protein